MKNNPLALIFAVCAAFAGIAQASEDVTPIPNISEAWHFEVMQKTTMLGPQSVVTFKF